MQTSIAIDTNIHDAVVSWIVNGLPPGSCTTYLIRGKYNKAKAHAHPLIKPVGEPQVWQRHIDYMEEYIPAYLRENFSEWRGLKNMQDEDQMITMLLIMSAKDSRYIEALIKQAKA